MNDSFYSAVGIICVLGIVVGLIFLFYPCIIVPSVEAKNIESEPSIEGRFMSRSIDMARIIYLKDRKTNREWIVFGANDEPFVTEITEPSIEEVETWMSLMSGTMGKGHTNE